MLMLMLVMCVYLVLANQETSGGEKSWQRKWAFCAQRGETYIFFHLEIENQAQNKRNQNVRCARVDGRIVYGIWEIVIRERKLSSPTCLVQTDWSVQSTN